MSPDIFQLNPFFLWPVIAVVIDHVACNYLAGWLINYRHVSLIDEHQNVGSGKFDSDSQVMNAAISSQGEFAEFVDSV